MMTLDEIAPILILMWVPCYVAQYIIGANLFVLRRELRLRDERDRAEEPRDGRDFRSPRS